MQKGLFIILAILAALGFSACTTHPLLPQRRGELLAETTPAVNRPEPVSPQKKSVPAGTILRVRLYNAIDSGRHRSGDAFVASLSAPVTVEDNTVLPKGTIVHGIIRHASSSRAIERARFR